MLWGWWRYLFVNFQKQIHKRNYDVGRSVSDTTVLPTKKSQNLPGISVLVVAPVSLPELAGHIR
jgi:hypothetical protein